MINFRKVELENQKAYKPYMAQQQCRSCECTFANLYLWSRFYAVTATVENGMLLTKSEEGVNFTVCSLEATAVGACH